MWNCRRKVTGGTAKRGSWQRLRYNGLCKRGGTNVRVACLEKGASVGVGDLLVRAEPDHFDESLLTASTIRERFGGPDSLTTVLERNTSFFLGSGQQVFSSPVAELRNGDIAVFSRFQSKDRRGCFPSPRVRTAAANILFALVAIDRRQQIASRSCRKGSNKIRGKDLWTI